MPELPEVEVVRRGLATHITGARIEAIQVFHPRAVRNTPGGPAQVEAMLDGATVQAVRRRGKFMWLELGHGADQPAELPVIVHLGMSGQMLIKDPGTPQHKHLRIWAKLSSGQELWFVDQRTFGYWEPADFGPDGLPAAIAHIAPDLLDPTLDLRGLARTIKARNTPIKRVLMDQHVVSGIGNIYADEMLWEARIHPLIPAKRMSLGRVEKLLEVGREVMRRALAQGGTSFDALYVNVNGESGYFDVSLNAYGRTGKPCPRCGEPIARLVDVGRSGHFCRRCQRRR